MVIDAYRPAPDVAGRVSTAKGDFFTDVPHGYPAYIMSRIIHDWPDDEHHGEWGVTWGVCG